MIYHEKMGDLENLRKKAKPGRKDRDSGLTIGAPG
jgi:hypothetical protein